MKDCRIHALATEAHARALGQTLTLGGLRHSLTLLDDEAQPGPPPDLLVIALGGPGPAVDSALARIKADATLADVAILIVAGDELPPATLIRVRDMIETLSARAPTGTPP